MLIVIVVPYIETIIFHAAPLGIYWKLKDRFDINKYWDFLIGGLCGLIFGILHGITYSSIRLKGLNFTIIGWLYSYIFFRYKRLGKKARYGIWIIHALNNLVAILPLLMIN
ncbi:MAG: CPBP family intramembrane metalloprotease [Tissierellia bacterium]|nr:CPBP family intramembrane metalloprotease [Tissierellia bacterium]